MDLLSQSYRLGENFCPELLLYVNHLGRDFFYVGIPLALLGFTHWRRINSRWGLAIILGGWVLAMSGLFVTQSNTVRILLASAGIAVSVYGNLGVLNKYYLDRALWKK